MTLSPASAKRCLDLVLAAPALVVAAPVILVLMAAVRATSAGPAIFAQERVGRGERPFYCYKLRTMRQGSPSVPTHQAAASSITPLGRWLRRFKLDELPQLWNVVRGEMSLVGPRPCLPTQVELIEHRRRLGVYALRPGISGLAQTRGIDMSQPLLCAQTDAEYLRRHSISGDLRLLLATLMP